MHANINVSLQVFTKCWCYFFLGGEKSLLTHFKIESDSSL